MNAKLATTTLIVLSSLVAGTSFAGDTSSMPQVGDYDVVRVAPSASNLTRAAVIAEYQAGTLNGVLPQTGDVDVVYAQTAPSNLSREAVRAEYQMARKAGNLPRNGELS